MKQEEVREILDSYYLKFNRTEFIETDPISIPHSYEKKQDIEITAFWTAILAWGLRKTIINKAKELFRLMDNAPYDFILNHKPRDRKVFVNFKHRTFNYTDTLYFLEFLQFHYKHYESLEHAFLSNGSFISIRDSLINFRNHFLSLEDFPMRTKKHVSSPLSGSSCKRLNMLFRWMVRKDNYGVDLGLWKSIPIKELMLPLDVHVGRTSRRLGLLSRKQNDWKAVEELTEKLRIIDPADPSKYDFALLGLGLEFS